MIKISDRRFLGLIVAVAVSAVILFAFLLYRAVHDFRGSLADMRRRHLEATDTINNVYSWYRAKNRWPSKSEFDASVRLALASDWVYDSDGKYAGLMIHGPYHTILVYQFEPPAPGSFCRTWTLSMEGDKSQFQGEVEYSDAAKK
jgi:hypothetical protein